MVHDFNSILDSFLRILAVLMVILSVIRFFIGMQCIRLGAYDDDTASKLHEFHQNLRTGFIVLGLTIIYLWAETQYAHLPAPSWIPWFASAWFVNNIVFLSLSSILTRRIRSRP